MTVKILDGIRILYPDNQILTAFENKVANMFSRKAVIIIVTITEGKYHSD